MPRQPTKPGPQPCNRVPPTYAAALKRAARGRPKIAPVPPHRAALRRLVRGWLLDEFDPLTETLLGLAARLDRLERHLGRVQR